MIVVWSKRLPACRTEEPYVYSVSFGLLRTLTLVVSTVAVAGNGVSAQSFAAERDKIPNLTGAWTLNKDLSDWITEWSK